MQQAIHQTALRALFIISVIASPRHEAALKKTYGGVAISRSGNETINIKRFESMS